MLGFQEVEDFIDWTDALLIDTQRAKDGCGGGEGKGDPQERSGSCCNYSIHVSTLLMTIQDLLLKLAIRSKQLQKILGLASIDDILPKAMKIVLKLWLEVLTPSDNARKNADVTI